MRRVFIAIKIPEMEEVTQLFTSLHKSLAGEKIKWVEPCNIHITLAFLGELTDEEIEITRKVTGRFLTRYARFGLDLRSVGIFARLQMAKVIWIGIEQSSRLGSLQKDLVTILTANQLYGHDSKFTPHITIGRVKGKVTLERVKTVTEKFKNRSFGCMIINEIILYESILKPAGPVYKPLEIFKLG